MKKIIISFASIAILVLLCSCEVRSKTTSDIQFATIQEIHQNTPKQKEFDGNKIYFNGAVLTPNTDKVYSLKYKRSDVYFERFDEIGKIFFEDYDPAKVELQEYNMGKNFYSKTYNDNGEDLNVSEAIGTFGHSNDTINKYTITTQVIDGQEREITNSQQPAWVQHYKIYLGEQPSDEENLMLDNTSLSPKKALEQVENFFDKHISKIEDDFSFEVRSLFVRRFDDGKYLYDFVIERRYKGVSICSKSFLNENIYFEMNGNVTRVGTFFNCKVQGSSGCNSWNILNTGDGNFVCEVEDMKELPNNFVTFDSALQILDNSSTAISKINIDYAEFCYDFSYAENVQENYLIDNFNSNPVWAFYSLLTENDVENIKNYGELARIYLVDAVTGELYVYHDNIILG